MKIAERNELFTEIENVVHMVARRNMGMLGRLRIDYADLYQILAIRALKAIEEYDANRGMSLKNYVFKMLQYEVYNLNNECKRACRAASFLALSLDVTYEDSDEPVIEPVYVEDYDTAVYMWELLGPLSDREREAVDRRVNGEAVTHKRQRFFLANAKRKIKRFYLMEATT